MKIKNLPTLLISIIGCELVGILGSVFTFSAIPTWYASLNKPSFSPPNWLFGPVWTLLYFLMGISLYILWQKDRKNKKVKTALNYFFAQLAVNFIWTPIFFGLKTTSFALIVIILMWLLIILTMKHLYPLSKVAFYLLVPYLLWVSFASVLNAAIVVLN